VVLFVSHFVSLTRKLSTFLSQYLSSTETHFKVHVQMNYSQFLTDVHVEYNSLNCVVLLDGKYIKIINGKI